MGTVFGGGGVDFGQKTGAVLGKCRDAFGSRLQWKKKESGSREGFK